MYIRIGRPRSHVVTKETNNFVDKELHSESVVEFPPFAWDDRHARLALLEEDRLCGRAKSNLQKIEDLLD